MEGFEMVNESELHVMDEVIVESKHFDYKTGYPVQSDFYRTIAGTHMTVSGERFHLASEPNMEFPSFPHWQGRWIYAGNDMMTQMWRRSLKGESDV